MVTTLDKVSVLDGGLKMVNEKKPVTDKIIKFDKSEYAVIENKSLVKNKEQIKKNIISKNLNLLMQDQSKDLKVWCLSQEKV